MYFDKQIKIRIFICLYPLLYFVFLVIFSENGLFFISSRIPVPIVPGTQAHQPVYAGR